MKALIVLAYALFGLSAACVILALAATSEGHRGIAIVLLVGALIGSLFGILRLSDD